MEASSENETTLVMELNKPTNNDDLDFIKLFLETKKKSDGGDIKYCQHIDGNKKFKIIFEETDTKQRLLNKKYILFRDYLIRFSNDGYKNEAYELNKKNLIIKNIQNETDTRIYAVYLMPDNDIKEITKSSILKDTYYVEYTNEIDKEVLMNRYDKKSQLKSIHIDLFDSYQTNTYLIKHSDPASSIQILANNLIDMNSNKYFIDNIDDIYSLIQFDSRLPNDLFISLSQEMKTNDYLVESLFNFKLLDDFNNGWIEKSPKKQKKNQNVIFDSYLSIDSKEIDLKSINPSNYLILDANRLSTRSILKCNQIFKDFNKDLEHISPNISLRLNDSKVIVTFDDGKKELLERKINDLCSVYDTEKLSALNISIQFINHKKIYEIFFKNLITINSNAEINRKFQNLHGSNKCVQINLIENNSIIEIYGYKKAVTLCEFFVRRCFGKSGLELKKILKKCLDIKYDNKINPLVDVFNKFDNNIFLSILNKSLLQLNAIAILSDWNKTIKIESFNDFDLNIGKNRIVKRHLFSMLCPIGNDIFTWSDNVNKCIKSFLSNFALVTLKIPFKPTDQETSHILYDKNRLDIVWLNENTIRILGIKTEIENFKKDLY
jgi:hypothetical protein